MRCSACASTRRRRPHPAASNQPAESAAFFRNLSEVPAPSLVNAVQRIRRLTVDLFIDVLPKRNIGASLSTRAGRKLQTRALLEVNVISRAVQDDLFGCIGRLRPRR